MIITALLYTIYAVLWAITYPIRVLADATLPSGLSTALTNAGAYMQNIDNFFPVYSLLAIIGSLLVIEGFVMTYKIVMWGIKRLPTQS